MLRDIFYKCFPDLLGGLYFRLGINLVPESKYPIEIGGVKKVCILATSGPDNLTTLTPMIRSLRCAIPDVRITVVVSSDEAKDVIEGGDLADEIVVLDSSGQDARAPKRKLKEIRGDWPDLTIDAAHRGFVSAKMAFRTGAMYRLGFRYDHGDKLDTGFLLTHTVPLDKSKSEMEQRLDLVRSLDL
jgi:ADP-heptose:LPS heptosyltransferase